MKYRFVNLCLGQYQYKSSPIRNKYFLGTTLQSLYAGIKFSKIVNGQISVCHQAYQDTIPKTTQKVPKFLIRVLF